jgi:DNA-binding SARP family transcriptional activator
VEYRILGPLDVVADERRQPLGGAKQYDLLSLLVLRAGQVVGTERLLDELWAGNPPKGAPVTLRSHLSRLRRSLEQAAGRPVILTRARGYLLDAGTEEIDAERFEQILGHGRAALAEGRPDRASELLSLALGLWRGPVLEGAPELDVVRAERARLEALRFVALEARIEADLALGRHAALIGELDALLAEHPLRESLHGQRMLALYRSGRQAEALAAFRDARELLAEELGIEPSNTLRQLHEAILRQLPELDRTLPAQAMTCLDPVPAEPFVGREKELAQLRAALADAGAERGRLILLTGEPGIGKTRTAQQLAAEARAQGFQVLTGRAWEEDGAPTFWPWVQALRTWLERVEPQAMQEICGPEATVLAQFVPAVADRIPELGFPARLEPAEARFRLFDAVTRTLSRASARQPVLLILDDLHWADVSSLRLLQFLARELAQSRLLVIGTYRDIDEGFHPAFRDVIAELWREPTTQHLRLPGLRPAEVARYAELVLGEPVPESLIVNLQRRTGGNIFFLRELVRLVLEQGGLQNPDRLGDLVPHGVLATVERRLGMLPAQARISLTHAAVIAPFSLETLKAATGTPLDSLVDHLEQASAAGLVAELPDDPGRYGFVHPLVRDALCTAVSGVRRARLRRRMSESMERLDGKDPEGHLSMPCARSGN